MSYADKLIPRGNLQDAGLEKKHVHFDRISDSSRSTMPWRHTVWIFCESVCHDQTRYTSTNDDVVIAGKKACVEVAVVQVECRDSVQKKSDTKKSNQGERAHLGSGSKVNLILPAQSHKAVDSLSNFGTG